MFQKENMVRNLEIYISPKMEEFQYLFDLRNIVYAGRVTDAKTIN